jgi:hypothetical protein
MTAPVAAGAGRSRGLAFATILRTGDVIVRRAGRDTEPVSGSRP